MILSLKNKLLVPTLLIIFLGTSSFAFIAYNRAKEAFNRMIIEEINQVAETSITGMSAWIRDRRIDIEDWSRQRLYQTALLPTFLGNTARTYASRQLKKIKADYGYYENIVVADLAGAPAALADPDLDPGLEGASLPWSPDQGAGPTGNQASSRALSQAISRVSNTVFRSPATGDHIFAISSPITNTGAPVGFLAGLIRAETLINRYIAPIRIGENGYAYVVKEDGDILAVDDILTRLGANVLDHDFGSGLIEHPGGVVEYRLKDQDMTAVVRKFTPVGWTLVVCAHTDEILAPVRELRNLYLTISLVIIMLVSLALILITNSFIRPVRHLVTGLERMGKGDLSHRIRLDTRDEIASIGRAMNQMAVKLQAYQEKISVQNLQLTRARDELEQKVEERTRDLKQAEEKYRSIFENAVEGIFRVDQSGRFIHANPAMAKILGVEGPEGLTGVVDNLFADIEALGTLRRRLDFQEEVIGFETRIRRRDGTGCWCSISVRLIPADGQICFEGSVLDISERIEKEKAQKEKEAALAASRVKSEFLANMSHEIRTPLNAIIGFCGLLKDRITAPDQLNYVRSIISAGNALLRLINDILDLSKMEAGKLTIAPTDVSIPRLLNEVRQMFEPDILDKELVCRIDLKSPFTHTLRTDDIRLRQILVNLVGNAVKFTHKGQINILAEQRPSKTSSNACHLCIAVEDTGIGIRQRHLDRIFESFEQVDASIRKEYGGTGLGLPICSRLVTAMGGDIHVASTPETGSYFTITFDEVALGGPDTTSKSDLPSVQDLPAVSGTPSLEPSDMPEEFKTEFIARIVPGVRSFEDAVVVSDVLAWARQLAALADAHGMRQMSDFSRELIGHTESFDILMIQRKLKEFQHLARRVTETD